MKPGSIIGNISCTQEIYKCLYNDKFYKILNSTSNKFEMVPYKIKTKKNTKSNRKIYKMHVESTEQFGSITNS